MLLLHLWSMRLLKGTLASGYKLSICWARNYKQGRWTLSRLSCKVRSWSRKSLNFIEKSQVAAQMLLVRIRDWLGALLGPPATMSKMVALLELQQYNEARKPTWSINQSVESFRAKASKQLIMENSISQFSCCLPLNSILKIGAKSFASKRPQSYFYIRHTPHSNSLGPNWKIKQTRIGWVGGVGMCQSLKLSGFLYFVTVVWFQ